MKYEIQNPPKFKCVLIHEIGHFLAHKLSNNLVLNISLEYKTNAYEDDYLGKTDFKILNNDFVSNVVSLFYGCMIESVFIGSLGSKISSCFNNKGYGSGRGERDYETFKTELIKRKLENKENLIISFFEEQLEKFKKIRIEHFDDLINIEYESLINNKEEYIYSININLLERKLETFINSHRDYYQAISNNLEQLMKAS